MEFIYDDGGRKAAGYKGTTGDCACRAIAIVTGLPYQEVYDLIKEYAAKERPGSKRRGGKRSHPRTGVFSATMKRIMKDLGWTWVPCKGGFGGSRGPTVHLHPQELPPGRILCRVSKHYVAVVDGVVHDTYDPTRDETRLVYGFWHKIPSVEERREAKVKPEYPSDVPPLAVAELQRKLAKPRSGLRVTGDGPEALKELFR